MAEEISKPKWWLVDAQDKVLGRLASQVASLLRGKHKATFAPHQDHGDFVVVINAARVKLTGDKWKSKIYYSHSGYPGGLKAITAGNLLSRYPERVVRQAVKGMLPKNKLADRLLRKLKVYPGREHPHPAQQPEVLELRY